MQIAVTGHRPDKLGNEYDLSGPYSEYIRNELLKVVDSHRPETIISGMALGVDTIWAKIALERRIPLIAAVPFEGQDKVWNVSSKAVYHEILDHPMTDIFVVNQGGYAAWKMQTRNQWMVDNCDLLVGVWDGTEGGTCNCLRYALKVGRKIHHIDPNGWKK